MRNSAIRVCCRQHGPRLLQGREAVQCAGRRTTRVYKEEVGLDSVQVTALSICFLPLADILTAMTGKSEGHQLVLTGKNNEDNTTTNLIYTIKCPKTLFRHF